MFIFEGAGSAFSKILSYQSTLSYGAFRCTDLLLQDVFLYGAENEGQRSFKSAWILYPLFLLVGVRSLDPLKTCSSERCFILCCFTSLFLVGVS